MKKQWISVKCGLSRDPKHRRQMGKSVWTFLHMLDLADWETGIVYDWKDENAAEDMGIDIRVLREDRRKLDEEGYITCKQKQYGQDIYIHNWTNPREYSGEVRNVKEQGGKKSPPSDFQGDSQGYAQGSVKDVTPTSYSKNKDHGTNVPNTSEYPIDWQLANGGKVSQPDQFQAQIRDAANLMDMGAAGAGALAFAFMAARNIVIPESKIKGNRKAAREMLEMHVKPEHVRQATLELVDKGMTVTDLFSVSKTAIDLANKPAAKQEPAPKSFPTLVNGRVQR